MTAPMHYGPSLHSLLAGERRLTNGVGIARQHAARVAKPTNLTSSQLKEGLAIEAGYAWRLAITATVQYAIVDLAPGSVTPPSDALACLSVCVALFVTLLTGTWLAHDSLAQVSCDPGELFDTKQCAQAIAQIVYDKPQNTLDRFSTIFAKLAGNCTIIVQNPQKRAITKQQIEAGYAKIFDQCQPNAGQAPVGDAYLLSQNHSSEHDTDFFPPRTLTCGLNLNAPLTAEKDCEDAFKSILVDRQGRLLGDKNKPAPTILKTLQTCTVLIYTTDHSPLIAKKSEIGSVVSKTIKQCKGKSGVVSMTKGGSGNNGLTVVKVRSSKRCGSRVDSEGQVCY
ncbi:hypothetical protein KEM48_001180 [Puccinia striiformis f. sp. tritici PST-130]|nr:hypothetical protein KEM48_001180 [Puccinia striiformis f. sp. tritici PST-130]